MILGRFPTSSDKPNVHNILAVTVTIEGSVGLSERFSTVLKTMWDNVGVERAVSGRFQAGGEREERVQGFRARGL